MEFPPYKLLSMPKNVQKSDWYKERGKNMFEVRSKMPSETVPNEALSVQEMLLKYSKGIDITGAKVPVWHEGDFDAVDISKVQDLDIHDRMEFKRELEESIESARKQLKRKEAQKPALNQSEAKESETVPDAVVIDSKPVSKPPAPASPA